MKKTYLAALDERPPAQPLCPFCVHPLAKHHLLEEDGCDCGKCDEVGCECVIRGDRA